MNKVRKYGFSVRGKRFSTGTHIMGILNATPDSFYSESRVLGDIAARAEKMALDGAEILDIGGQSTRPTALKVGVLEELSRVIPAIQAVRETTDVPISVDTFYPEVARAALEAGADMINDVSCLAHEDMAELIAEYGASVCIMHDRRKSNIPDLFTDKIIGLNNALKKLFSYGVGKDKIILDGGIGFNKSREEDLELLKRYGELADEFGELPFLLGASRKSLFGGEVESRLSATLDSTLYAVRQGILFVRVHDVADNFKAICTERTDENL